MVVSSSRHSISNVLLQNTFCRDAIVAIMHAASDVSSLTVGAARLLDCLLVAQHNAVGVRHAAGLTPTAHLWCTVER